MYKGTNPPSLASTIYMKRRRTWFRSKRPAKRVKLHRDTQDSNEGVGLQNLPNEVLAEIFRWAVEDDTLFLPHLKPITDSYFPRTVLHIRIAHVCSQWRKLAIATIWNRVYLDLGRMFQHCFPPPHEEVWNHFISLLPPQQGLDIHITALKWIAPGALQSIVLDHAARIKSLHLEIDDDDMKVLLHLPPNTFPILRHLSLVYLMAPYFRVFPPDGADFTPISQLAPRLMSFGFFSIYTRHIEPRRFGLDLCSLTKLNLSTGVTEDIIYDVLHLTPSIQSLAAWITKSRSPNTISTSDDSEESDEDEEDEDTIESIATSDAENVPAIILHHLTDLNLGFGSAGVQARFMREVGTPSLAALSLQPNVSYTEALHKVTLQFLRRSTTTRPHGLTSLVLHGVKGLSEAQFRELLTEHGTDLTELCIDSCSGSLWDVFNEESEFQKSSPTTEAPNTPPLLLPNLAAFTCIGFEKDRARGIVDFIDGRNSKNGNTKEGTGFAECI
ncbi:hypothetical protein R3P38DRAFT_3415175 [Favolaschia claudopus]|uniref:F-box domain-containing protein n=1 Tax=Favolaschia claudopus TaxID=2862362 RepID=A0AAW0EF58_9AGAR